MSLREIHVCDGCGKILERIEDRYHMSLRTDRFWNGADMDYFQKHLEFCERCAEKIKQSLEKIAERLKGGQDG